MQLEKELAVCGVFYNLNKMSPYECEWDGFWPFLYKQRVQEREESVYLPGVILYTCCKSLSYAYLWADSINTSNTTIPLYVLG